LGTGATLESLRRLRSGPFGLGDAVTLDAVVETDVAARILPLEALLTDRPSVTVTREGADWVAHGREVGPAQCAGGPSGTPAGAEVRLLDPGGRLVAIGEAMPGGVLRPAVVLV
jgi:tRNA pseudouridine55 synthase